MGSRRSGFNFITTCGDLTGGFQDANYLGRVETLKTNKVCSRLLSSLLCSFPCVGAHSLLDDVASLDLLVTGEMHSVQVARIYFFFRDSVHPPS